MSKYKVGDRLAFSHSGKWRVYLIDRITPSGRIVCGPYTLNPDLSIRGPEKWGPYRACAVTEEIEKACRRREYLDILSRVRFDELTDDVLDALVEVLEGPLGENRG
jgi:hypothetical protein